MQTNFIATNVNHFMSSIRLAQPFLSINSCPKVPACSCCHVSGVCVGTVSAYAGYPVSGVCEDLYEHGSSVDFSASANHVGDRNEASRVFSDWECVYHCCLCGVCFTGSDFAFALVDEDSAESRSRFDPALEVQSTQSPVSVVCRRCRTCLLFGYDSDTHWKQLIASLRPDSICKTNHQCALCHQIIKCGTCFEYTGFWIARRKETVTNAQFSLKMHHSDSSEPTSKDQVSCSSSKTSLCTLKAATFLICSSCFNEGRFVKHCVRSHSQVMGERDMRNDDADENCLIFASDTEYVCCCKIAECVHYKVKKTKCLCCESVKEPDRPYYSASKRPVLMDFIKKSKSLDLPCLRSSPFRTQLRKSDSSPEMANTYTHICNYSRSSFLALLLPGHIHQGRLTSSTIKQVKGNRLQQKDKAAKDLPMCDMFARHLPFQGWRDSSNKSNVDNSKVSCKCTYFPDAEECLAMDIPMTNLGLTSTEMTLLF